MLAKAKKDSHIKAAANGLILSLCLICFSSGILALMIHFDVFKEENIKYGSLIILLLSAFIGNVASIKSVEQRRWLACLLHGVAVFVSLIIMSITLFGGPKGGVTATALVISGIAVAVLLLFGKERRALSKTAKLRRH